MLRRFASDQPRSVLTYPRCSPVTVRALFMLKCPRRMMRVPMELDLAMRRRIAAAGPRVAQGHPGGRGSVALDAVCATTGWHRDHTCKAIRQLIDRGVAAPVDNPGSRPALRAGGDRGAAVVLGGAGHAQRQAASTPTTSLRRCWRWLAADRAQLSTRKGTPLTRPSRMLKSSIRFKTWAELGRHRPGFCLIDRHLFLPPTDPAAAGSVRVLWPPP